MKTLNEKIIDLAVERYYSRDYGSLQYAIRYYNILDDEADQLFDELLPIFLEKIWGKD